MKTPKIPALGYALMGLLQAKPSSGYDLRKIFSSTSMKTYSDSPGAIYPALRRLERQQLVRGKIEETSGLRRRQIFHLTAKGLTELKRWIAAPIAREDLPKGYDEIVLRFAFSEHVAGPAASLVLLKNLSAATEEYLRRIREEFRVSRHAMLRSGWLAFESGIRGTESMLHWTEHAISVYEQENRAKGGTL